MINKIWQFPLKIQKLDTSKEGIEYVTFEKEEDFEKYVRSQFKLPGKYNLKNTKRWQDAGMQYANSVSKPNFEGGQYTKSIKGTHKYKQFWSNEKEKVKNGVIIDNIYIPPFYYWYLNFCPIYNDVIGKKMFGHVWDSDLWFFHYITLCMVTGKHACIVKTRQRGYSFKIMSLLYWSYCWFESSVNTIGAYKEEYTVKSWRFLEFYRKHLNSGATAWKRGPIVPKSLEWYERTPLVDGGYVGLDSKLSATTFKVSPENGVGGSQTIFFYEEAGVAPTLLQTLGYIRPALEKGNKTTGLIICSGSVGDLDDAEDIKEVFYDPDSHNFLGIENIWDDNEMNGKSCGLFVSEAYNLEGFIDSEGNSDVEKATEFVKKNNEAIKSKKRKDLAQLDISQKPLSPKEAFAQRKSSEFPIDELLAQQERIKIKDKENKWKFKPVKCTLEEDESGKVKLKTTNLPEEHKYPIVPDWEDKRGVVTIYEMPEENPKWLTNFAGIDTVEVDVTTTSHSVMTVDIYKRMVKVKYRDTDGKIKTRVEGGKIVATYRGRHNPVEKSNEQAWLLIKMYNAFSYVERSKPNFINYMKRNGRAEKYLAKESDVPVFKDLNVNSGLSASNYGFIISPQNNMWKILKSNVKEYFQTEFDRREKPDGEVLKIYNGIDRTDDYWLIEEYVRYNEKDNFDRIVSHGAAITIGKVYESEFGIPTINEVKEEPKEQIYIPPKKISMLGGQTKKINTNKRFKKSYSIL
jgi:hypothetical protein